MLSLKSESREKGATAAFLRGKGLLPAIFYGPKEKATPITVPAVDFRKVWRSAGESTIVTLETAKGKVPTLIHDVQFDPVKGDPIHADFYVIEEGKEVEIHVPIEFTGVAPAVKEFGATLIKVLHELSIKALPQDLPHSIPVGVSALATLESQVLVKDITPPKGVTILTHADEVVASLAAARKEEEEVPAEPVDLSTIEVEKKGKKEEEGEAPSEGGEGEK